MSKAPLTEKSILKKSRYSSTLSDENRNDGSPNFNAKDSFVSPVPSIKKALGRDSDLINKENRKRFYSDHKKSDSLISSQ